jgi:hypothetical protein
MAAPPIVDDDVLGGIKPMKTVYLHENGGNKSLFGEDRHGKPYRARRVREAESNLGIVAHTDQYYGAASDAPPARLRPRVVQHITNAIVEADRDGHAIADDLRDILARHQVQREAAESRENRRLHALNQRMARGDAVEKRVALQEWSERLKR